VMKGYAVFSRRKKAATPEITGVAIMNNLVNKEQVNDTLPPLASNDFVGPPRGETYHSCGQSHERSQADE